MAYPPLERLRSIEAAEIELIFANYDGYQLLLRDGNVVIFPREKWIALNEFVRSSNIPVVTGTDPWNLIADPYLDQSFTPAEHRATIEWLGRLGFKPREVSAIRRKVAPWLIAYNIGAWEWVSMGLLEVLYTHKPATKSFYEWVTSISRRGYEKARPCDLVKQRHLTGVDGILWGNFDLLSRSQGLWPKVSVAVSSRPRGNWFRRLLSSGQSKETRIVTSRPSYAELKSVYSWLVQRYSEPHRHYHNINHLEYLLSVLDGFYPQTTAATTMAGWFHDSIYHPGASDNEEQSAQQIERHCRPLKANAEVLEKARRLVLYTKDHKDTHDHEEQMIHDADLAILGFNQDSYAKYASDIRQEYAFVPNAEFRKGRAELLTQMLRNAEKRGRFFYLLDPIFERQAAVNLEWEIKALSA